jgi:hypothetical protein
MTKDMEAVVRLRFALEKLAMKEKPVVVVEALTMMLASMLIHPTFKVDGDKFEDTSVSLDEMLDLADRNLRAHATRTRAMIVKLAGSKRPPMLHQ